MCQTTRRFRPSELPDPVDTHGTSPAPERCANLCPVTRVLHLIATDVRRGAEIFAYELAEHHRAAGHEVRVMAVEPTATGETLDVEVAGSSRRDPRGFARIVAAARGAEVVVSFGSTSLIAGAAAARLARRPFVYRNIGDPSVWGEAKFAQARIGAPVRTAAAVVALYPEARDVLVSRYRLDPSRVRVIPRGVPDDRFRPATHAERARARADLGLTDDRRWVGYVGALSSEKDPLAAVDLLGRLPDDVGLVMAGGGPMHDEVLERAAAYTDRAVILGPLADVRPLFAAIDALVLTSRTEGIPGSVIEAGLSAVPTIATAVGGVPHVIQDGAGGRVVALDEPDAFAAAVVDVLGDRERFAVAAAERCRSMYSMSVVGRAWEGVLSDLTSRPSTSVLNVVTSTERRGAELFATQLEDRLGERGTSAATVAISGAEGDNRLDIEVIGPKRFHPRTLARLVRRARAADLVIAHGSDALVLVAVAAATAGRPYVYRNIGDPLHWGAVRFAGLRISRPLRRAARVVALSERARQVIVEAHGVAPDRCVVLPNAIDDHDLGPLARDRRRDAFTTIDLEATIDPAAPVIGYLGALSAEKRPEWAIDAIAAIPTAHLVVAGDGPLREQVRQHAEAVAPGRVHLLGRVTRVVDVLAAIDVLVLPSVTEGTPAALLEAAVCGIPVVATDVGNVGDIVRSSGLGALVGRDDHVGFVAAVADAVDDPERRLDPSVGERVRAQFGWASQIDGWFDVVQQATRPLGERDAHP